MTDDAVLEILKAIQADVSDLRRQTEQHTHLLNGLTSMFNVQGGFMNALQQDVRMIRAALNDIERTRVSSGEIEAIHTDLNRLQHDQADLAARVGVLESER